MDCGHWISEKELLDACSEMQQVAIQTMRDKMAPIFDELHQLRAQVAQKGASLDDVVAWAIAWQRRDWRMKRYVFVRKRQPAELHQEWESMSAVQKAPWVQMAAEANDQYEEQMGLWKRGRCNSEPKRPRAAYFLWVQHLKLSGRLCI